MRVPRVSIALCTFNGGRYLRQQLESLLAQDYEDFEIVICDDASSDDTLAIIEWFAQQERRIRYTVNPSNIGFQRNFEHTLKACRGALIAPCDQDDLWQPTKLGKLVAAIEGHALAYCDSLLVDEEGKPAGPKMSAIVHMVTTDDPAIFAFGNCVSGHAMLFRRELLERALPIPDAFFYDWWIAAVAAAMGGIMYWDESLVMYRQHGANVTDTRLGEMLSAAGFERGLAKPTQARCAGHKLRYLRETQTRLAALARLPGKRQPFIAELHRLWSERERRWLSLRLAGLMARQRRRLLALAGFSERKAQRYCRDLIWGVRLKRITDRHGYVLD